MNAVLNRKPIQANVPDHGVPAWACRCEIPLRSATRSTAPSTSRAKPGRAQPQSHKVRYEPDPVQLAAQGLGQIPGLVGTVGVKKIALVAYRYASLRWLVDIGKNVQAVGGQGNARREAIDLANGYRFGDRVTRPEIAAGSTFTRGLDLSAPDQLRDQAPAVRLAMSG